MTAEAYELAMQRARELQDEYDGLTVEFEERGRQLEEQSGVIETARAVVEDLNREGFTHEVLADVNKLHLLLEAVK